METKKRKFAALLAAAAVSLGAVSSFPMSAQAQNPLVQTAFSPDPAPVVFGDELWVFTGCDRDGNNDNYYMTGWQAFSTTDMQNWTNHGMILKDNEFKWCTENNAWASQCIERNGKYYFYFTTTNNGRCIGVGVADKPEGPYEDVLGKPLCGPDWEYIDPTVIIDDDGQAWLMFGNPKCYYVKLKEDMVTLDGPIQTFNLSLPSGTRYGEGPWIYKHDSLYYLVFASFVDAFGGESISYCTGPSVTGPWTFRGTIHEGSNCFTTHGGIIDYKGHSYSFYHMNGLPGGGSYNRSAACEEFTYGSDGSIPALKSTKEGPKQLEAFNPYQRIEAETMSWSSGIKAEKHDSGVSIGFIEDGDYTKISGVDFGDEGAGEFYASVGSAGDGGKIEVHLDSVSGPMVASVDVSPTGGWNTFETVSAKCSGATGKHDVFFCFTGGSSYLFNADWWQFREANSKPVRLGDVNSDGVISAVDLALAKRIALGSTADSFAVTAADVNCSGKVDADDINWFVQFLTAQTDKLPEKNASGGGSESGGGTEIGGGSGGGSTLGTDGFQYPENLSWHEFPREYLDNMGDQSKRGQVIEEKYNGVCGNKTMYVYLPPGYDSSKKYNVFYLMHGGNENERTLFFQSDTMMQNIFDHMIANGELDPLIVVTPTFNGCPNGSYDVYDEIRRTIIPYVETKYSTYAKSDSIEDLKASRYHRAYGGFSMGGGSTWINLLNNLDIIAYYRPLSGHNWGGVGEIQQAIDKSGFSQREYFIFAATGSTDIAYNNMLPQINEMKADTKRFTYTSDFSKGNFYFLVAPGKDHWWGNVRHYVYDALPLFFHENQG